MFKFTLLESHPLIQAISTAEYGNIDRRFSENTEVEKNLKIICNEINLEPLAIVQMEQVHKTNVRIVDKNDRGKIIKDTDALITNDPHVVLMLRIADCIPIFVYDPVSHSIALIHSGWRGSLGKILLVAIERMMSEFLAQPKNMILALGPSIQVCCNTFSEPPIQSRLPEWQSCVLKNKGEYAVDIPNFNVRTALQAGLLKHNIESSKICTVTERSFFSHQRSKQKKEKESRFAALFGLKIKSKAKN